MFGVAVSMGIGPGHAQDLVWRCGQTLTNRLPEDEGQRGTCVPVSLPKVTTLPAPRFAPVAPPQSAGLVPRNERVQVDRRVAPDDDRIGHGRFEVRHQRLLGLADVRAAL